MTITTPPATKPTKAIVGAVAAGAVAGLGVVVAGLTDNVLTLAEGLSAISAAIVASGVTGWAVWGTTNAPK